MSKVPTHLQFSAGGVVYRQVAPGQSEVVLIATHGGRRWGLPKGWVEQGESPSAAAGREVREETGLVAEVVGILDRVEYWFRWQEGGSPIRVHKYVDFFLLRAVAGSLDEHDREVEEARWFPLDEAIERAAYEGERRILKKAQELLVSKPGLSSSPHSENEAS